MESVIAKQSENGSGVEGGWDCFASLAMTCSFASLAWQGAGLRPGVVSDPEGLRPGRSPTQRVIWPDSVLEGTPPRQGGRY